MMRQNHTKNFRITCIIRANKSNLSWSEQVLTRWRLWAGIQIRIQLARPDENLTDQLQPVINCSK